MIPIEQIRAANVIFVQCDSLQTELKTARADISDLTKALELSAIADSLQKDQLQLEQRRVSMFLQALKLRNKELKTAELRSLLIGSGAGAIATLLLTLIL